MRQFLVAAFSAAVVLANARASADADPPIDARTRAEVIDGVLERLDRSYVFPEVAQRMRDVVRGRLDQGEYDTIQSAREFAQKLTADLQAISRDKHLRVRVSGEGGQPQMMRQGAMRGGAGESEAGFARVELLAGNVGYIDLRMFQPPHVAARRAADAMKQVAAADALIIDLRKNSGGSADMVALLVSYLLEPEPTTLVNTFVGRDGKLQNETWTTKDLPGPRFTEKEVYVLTSNYTFSAAEEFAYDLQNLKRATLVGETTGGGANPVDMVRINDHFHASIPVARAVNPITKTNWEGVGVEPDVRVSAADALNAAHVAALQRRIERTGDASEREALERVLEATKRVT